MAARPADKPTGLASALIATAALLLAFAAAALPVPLYAEFQATIGITDAEVSMTMVFYLMGVLTVLFLGGSLSDALGRKPMVAASLMLGALGCVLFAWLPNAAVLQAARMVQGFSCGLAMSATSAFVLDCTSHHFRTFGTTITSTGALIGLTVGSLGIGFYAMASNDYPFIFNAFAIIMVGNALLLPLTHETVTHRITLRRAIRPLVKVPKSLRTVFPLAAGCYIASWGAAVFFQSLSTPAATEYFGSADPLIPALILALAMAPSALGGPMSARTTTRFAVAGGFAVLLGTNLVLWVSLMAHAMVPFLLVEVVCAISMGILLSASMHLLISYSDPADSASVVSLINFTGYIGSTVVSLSMSALAATMELSTVFIIGFAISIAFMIPAGVQYMAKSRR